MSTAHWAATVALDATFALLTAALLTCIPAPSATGGHRARLVAVARLAAAAAFCAAIVEIVLRSLEMADAPLQAVPANLPKVLLDSRIGHLWLIEAVAIATVGALAAWRGLPALVALVCWAASRSAVSHAAADGAAWPLMVQVLHELAMGAWVGSVWLAACDGWGTAGTVPTGVAERAAAARRLSTRSTWALAIVVLTGVLAVRRHVDSIAALTAGDAYVAWLRIKLVCVAVAVMIGAVNRWYTLPPLLAAWRDADPQASRWEARFRRLLRVESVVLLVAIAVAAKLASTEPPEGPSGAQHLPQTDSAVRLSATGRSAPDRRDTTTRGNSTAAGGDGTCTPVTSTGGRSTVRAAAGTAGRSAGSSATLKVALDNRLAMATKPTWRRIGGVCGDMGVPIGWTHLGRVESDVSVTNPWT